MKTAMQELIEKLDYSIKNFKDDYKINFEWIKFQAELLLEKEKEQIIDACNMGIDIESHLLINDGEEYYNQTYNNERIDTDNDRVY